MRWPRRRSSRHWRAVRAPEGGNAPERAFVCVPSGRGGTLARVPGKHQPDEPEFDDELDDKSRRKGRFDRGRSDVYHSERLKRDSAEIAFGAPRAEMPRRQKTKTRRNETLEDALRARLQPAGHDVMFRDDDVYVDGNEVGSGLRREFLDFRTRQDPLADDRAFGDVIHRFFKSLLHKRAKTQVKDFDRRLHVRRAPKRPGFDVMRGQKEVAYLTATSFTTASGEQHQGPFWAPGEHWNEALVLLLPKGERPKPQPPAPEPPADAPQPPVRESVEEAARQIMRGRALTPQPEHEVEQFTNWPEDAPGDLRRQAEQASDLLRSHRVRADDFPVEIDCGAGRVVTFQPLKRHPRSGRLRLPFELAAPQGVLRGLIYLASPKTPLTINIQHRDPTLPLPLAWALVFQVAAAKYCTPHGEADDEHAQPGGFTPDGATRDVLTHWVRAHRARLPEGRRAGDDAVKAAEEVDITLPDGYTWRKGHLRGRNHAVEIDGVLRYTWRPPPTSDTSGDDRAGARSSGVDD